MSLKSLKNKRTRKMWPDDKFVFGQVCYQYLNFVFQVTLVMFLMNCSLAQKVTVSECIVISL